MMPAPQIPSSTPLNPEKLYILLTYSTLLALTRDTSRPVVNLDMEAQVRQLDAFLAGDVTEDGVATHWSAKSKSFERIRRYEGLCDQLVPSLMAAIKKQSQINLNAEPKNRVNGDKNPEHQSFCELFLAPNLVAMYGKLAEKSRKKGINPDFDPWTDTTKYGKLIQLFQSIYEIQYDFTRWQHTRPKPVFNQTPRSDTEVFMRVMDHRGQIRVYHHVITRAGKVFSQLDTIPEIPIKYTDEQLAKMWRDKTRPRYLIPDPATVTISPKREDMTWVNDDGVGKIWTRGEASWSPNFRFMVFDKATNAYIYDHSVDVDLLDQIDLNNETWVNRYRKKISQWRRRATGEATKVRDHWIDQEHAVMYEFTNAWIKENGIDKFVTRVWEGDKDGVRAILANKARHVRSTESVCAWARKQMTDEPNEPLGMLYTKGQKMAILIAAGEDIPDDERYPDEAIDVAGFLAKPQPKKSSRNRKYCIEYGSKPGRFFDDEADGEEIMNDPRNFNLDGNSDQDAHLAMEDGDSDSDDNNLPPPQPKSSKRLKLMAKDRKLSGRATDEQDTTFAKPKLLSKAEIDPRTAQHDAGTATFETDVGDVEINMDFDIEDVEVEKLVQEDID